MIYIKLNKFNEALSLFCQAEMPNQLQGRVQKAAHVAVLVRYAEFVVLCRASEACVNISLLDCLHFLIGRILSYILIVFTLLHFIAP